MSQLCEVRGCDQRADDLFTSSEAGSPLVEWQVCAFHLQTLSEGGRALISTGRDALVVGVGLPVEVMDVRVVDSEFGSPVVTLTLGREDVEEDELKLQMTPAQARFLCERLNGEAPGGGESP